MFPKEFINKIKDTVDMVKLVQEYTDLTKCSNDIYIGHCPHKDHIDKNPSFRVWAKEKSWACMVCHCGKKNESYGNNGSDCIAFIQWIEDLSWRDAVLFLAQKYGIPIPKDKNEKLYKNNKNIAFKFIDNTPDFIIQYLKNRGLDEEDIFKWGLGYDKLLKRITFPLLDRYNNVLGFTKRWLIEKPKSNDKYINSPNSEIFNKGMYLYGIQNIDEDFPEIRITEGTFDVILAQKYGAKNVFATLGTAFTEKHMEILQHYNKIPVFCMDGDEAGLKAIERSAKMLAENGMYCKVLILPDKKDLADISLEQKENIEQYIQENSITYGNYKLNKEMSLYTSKANELKLKYYPKLLNILKQVPDKKEQSILKDYIKEVINISLD